MTSEAGHASEVAKREASDEEEARYANCAGHAAPVRLDPPTADEGMSTGEQQRADGVEEEVQDQ